MALQSKTITLGAETDSGNGGKNYVANKAVYIKTSSGTLAAIYTDINGATEIVQDGLQNRTNNKGQFTFFAEQGDYIAEYEGQQTPLSIYGADYFNSRIDESVTQITADVANSRGFRRVGTFASGFTYVLANDVGIDDSGDAWVYTDINSLPVTVSAGATPSEPEYTPVVFSDINAITGTEKPNILDDSYTRRVQNIDELKALEIDDSMIGNRIFINEYHAGTGYGGGEWEIVTSYTANDIDVIQSETNGSIQFSYKGYPNIESIGGGVNQGGETNSDVIERLWVLIQGLTTAPALRGGVVELGYGYYEFIRPVVQPEKIVVIGKGRGATWVVPSPSFSGDYLWRAGDIGSTAVTTCEIKDVALDAESIEGLVTYYSNSINEHSGLNNCLVKSNAQTAVLIDKANSGAPNNFYIKDTEVYVSNSNNTVDCIKLDMGGFQFREIYNVTVIGDKFTSTTAAGRSGRGIAITAAGGAVINYHGEACLELLSIGGDGSAFGINCSNVTDLGTIDKPWRIADSVASIESGSANVTLNNIDRTSAVNCINDKDSGTVIQDTKVAMYFIGGGVSGSKTVLTTSRNTRQILNKAKIIGNLTVNQKVISSNYTTLVSDGFVEVYGDTDVTLHDSALNPTSKISIVNAGGGAVTLLTSSGNLFYGSGGLAVSSLSANVGEVITFTASDFGVGRWYFSK